MEAAGAGGAGAGEGAGREELLRFVRNLQEDLAFVFEVSANEGYLHPVVAERLGPAWEALQERGEFEALEAAVARASVDVLTRAGLVGSELSFKLAGVAAARDDARRIRAPRGLRKLLKWSDVILGSLLAAVGAGEAIKEIKEGVEAELDSAE